jgi:GntR family carbon starvation induced transcriptional regulator
MSMEQDPTARASAATLGDLAFTRIREDILAGRLAPESRLRFDILREMYGQNVGTLREGLSRLLAEGLVTLEGRKGYSVSPISKNDLIDLTQLRLRSDTLALRASIERGDVEWEAEVVTAHHHLSRVSRPTPEDGEDLVREWEQRHRVFHRALVAGSRSEVLIQTHAILFDRAERYRRLGRMGSPGSRGAEAEHLALMRATLAREADLACSLLENHVLKTQNRLLRSMREILP